MKTLTICNTLEEKLEESGRKLEYVSVVCEPDKDDCGNYPNHKGYKPIDDGGLKSYKMDITNNKPCIDGMNFNYEKIYEYESKATILVKSKCEVPKHVRFTEDIKNHKYSYLIKHYNILGYFKDMDSKLEGTDVLISSCMKKKDKQLYQAMKRNEVLFIDTFYSDEFVESRDNLTAVNALIRAIKDYFREVNNGTVDPIKVILKGKEVPYICKKINHIKVIVRRSVLCRDISQYK